MNVLLLAQSFEPARGGGPRWTSELARGLAGRGHDVLVLTRTMQGAPRLEQPVPRLEIQREPMSMVRGSPIFTPALLRRHRGFRADVVQTSAPSLADTLMPSPGWVGAPFATLFHAQLGASLPAKIVQAANLYRLRREWSGIAVTSDHWRDWLVARGVRDDRIRTIPSTVSRRFASGAIPGVGRVAGEFVFVGGLADVQSYKRFDLLIAAAARLHRDGAPEPWRITVIGDGPLRRSYEEEVRAAGLGGRFAFRGSAADDELHAAYSRATAVVLPSSDQREGWGLVLAEALCCGCPVVLSDGIGGARTFGASPGATVVRAGDAEALAVGLRTRLASGPDGRDAERTAFARQFHADAVVEAYERMYLEIAGSGPVRP